MNDTIWLDPGMLAVVFASTLQAEGRMPSH